MAGARGHSCRENKKNRGVLIMQRIKKYEDWCLLSDEDKKKEYVNWDTYAQEGLNLLELAIEEVKKKYNGNKAISEISGGLYHGGLWVINIRLKNKKQDKLPKYFRGFPIMESYN
jgi:hypothetical protein